MTGLTYREAVLRTLRGGEGEEVERADLFAAMGQRPSRTANQMLVNAVNQLRAAGFDIRSSYGGGFRLRAEAPDDSPSPRKERRCLCGCGRMFLSEGPGNRINPKCGVPRGDALGEPYPMARP